MYKSLFLMNTTKNDFNGHNKNQRSKIYQRYLTIRLFL